MHLFLWICASSDCGLAVDKKHQKMIHNPDSIFEEPVNSLSTGKTRHTQPE
jgi:hypothetical protein